MKKNNLEKNLKFKSSNYKSLAPDYFEDYDNNANLLKSIIDSGKATNIGIVSKFGGGKSSFIRTFINKNKSIKSVIISIANIVGTTFNDEKVESVIIKQLVYSRKASKLPDSRIKRIGQGPKLWKYLLTTILIALSAVSFGLFSVFVTQPTSFNILNNWFGGNHQHFLLIEVLLLTCGILLISCGLSLILFNIRSFSLKFKDLEIKKDKDDTETLFFKYLDELVYFFKKTKTRIVFFEDLDRADEYLIFDKLRELNSILNSSITYKSKKKIFFIYACGDEVFNGEPNVKNKYFDFTFNIDPILTKENCASIILNNKLFSPLKEWLGDMLFIDRVSIYFEEMRTLLSVYNDCLLYLKNLDDSKLDKINSAEIFVIMTYRAIFPAEFKKLVEGDGELDKAIKSIKKAYKTSRPFDYLVSDLSLLNDHVSSERHRDFLAMVIKYQYLSSDFKDYILRTPASNSLSTDELDFLRNLNSNKYDKGSYFKKFENINRLYSKLGDNDYKDVHILNKYIIDDFINNKFDSAKDKNIQLAFTPKKEENIDYVNDFIVNYLLGSPDEPKEAGDKDNQEFFVKISALKNDLLKIILETNEIKNDFKKDLITDYIFAVSNNNSQFLAQEKYKSGILFVENYKRFRKNLVFYDWVIQYFDNEFEKIRIDEMQTPNHNLIKKLVVGNYIVLDRQSISAILNAYGQNGDIYLNGHFVFNSPSTATLFDYFNKNAEPYVNVILENEFNRVGINSLVNYCEAKIDKTLIDKLLKKREKNSPKLDLNPNLSPTAIISGCINDVFKQVNLSTISSTINASVDKYKDEIVSSELILNMLLSKTIDSSIKQYVIIKLLIVSNCTDDILKEISFLEIRFDDTNIKKLISFTEDKDIKVSILCSCSINKKSMLLAAIPDIDKTYKILVENKKARVTSDELDLLPGFNIIKNELSLKINKNKQYRIIKL